MTTRRDFLKLIGAGAAGSLLPLSLLHSRQGIHDGNLVYDPRSNSWKCSNNVALVMADLVCDRAIVTNWRVDKALDNPFWHKIAMLADFCDEIVTDIEPAFRCVYTSCD